MNSFAADWESYAKEVIPSGAPAVQLVECRRAFYAGAWALMQTLKVMDESMSEERGAELLSALERELECFKHAVLEGYA